MTTKKKATTAANAKELAAITLVAAEWLPLDSLTPWDDNPNKHPARQVAELGRAMKRWGFTSPLVVQRSTRKIVKGHGRRLAALKIGVVFPNQPAPGLVPVVFVDVNDDDARDLAISDNEIAAMSSRDERSLGRLLEQSKKTLAGLTGMGIAPRKAEKLIAKARVEVGKGEEIDQTPPADPVTRPGDLLILGEHRVVCGDAFDPAVRAQLFPGDRLADLSVTDPPYAIYGSSTGIGADIADDAMVRPFFVEVFRAILERVKVFAHVYAFCDWRSYPALDAGAKLSRLAPKNLLVWDKGGGGLGSSYANVYELIAFYARLAPPKSMKNATTTGQRMVNAPNLIRVNRASGEDRPHNAAKPVALVEMLIRNSSDPDDLVYDPFLGGGSTLIACELLGRRCFGTEKDPRYCDTIARRWEKATGKKVRWVRA